MRIENTRLNCIEIKTAIIIILSLSISLELIILTVHSTCPMPNTVYLLIYRLFYGNYDCIVIYKPLARLNEMPFFREKRFGVGLEHMTPINSFQWIPSTNNDRLSIRSWLSVYNIESMEIKSFRFLFLYCRRKSVVHFLDSNFRRIFLKIDTIIMVLMLACGA